jgi:hypothetical protein
MMRMARVVTVIAVLAATSAAAGCGGDGNAAAGDAARAGAATTPPGPSAAPPATPGDGAGIGASAARASGVLTAEFDAALRGPGRAKAGRVTLRLVNTGTRADSYRISVEPAGAATLAPATARLAPGATATLEARLVADATVHVFSAGRGAEVADLPLSPG